MKKFFLILGSIIIVILVGGGIYIYTKSQQKTKPPAALTEKLKITVPESNINLPISYEIKTFSVFLNKKINGKFLEKNIFLQSSKKEEVAITLSKKEEIIIKSTGKELICSFPLIVDAVLVDSRFGKKMARQVDPIHSSVLITLSTPASLDKTWSLVTKFKINSLKWIEEPVVKIGMIKKNLRKTIDAVIKDKGSDLTKMLDDELNKAVSLKPEISKIWDDIQKPILITRKPTPAWMRFFCKSIKGKIVLNPTKLICYTNVKADMLMLTDTVTNAKPNPLPDFNALKEKEKATASDVYLYAYTSFEEINDQLNELLKGKTITAEGYSIAIKQLKVYGSTTGLSVQVITDKDVEGDLVASGQLVFDVPNQTLKVQNFDFAVNTNSHILNTGDVLLHEILRDTIASKLAVNLDTLIDKVPTIVSKAIAKGNAGKVIDMDLENLEIKECEILMGKERIHFKVHVGVDAKIKIKHLNAGTSILVKDKPKVK